MFNIFPHGIFMASWGKFSGNFLDFFTIPKKFWASDMLLGRRTPVLTYCSLRKSPLNIQRLTQWANQLIQVHLKRCPTGARSWTISRNWMQIFNNRQRRRRRRRRTLMCAKKFSIESIQLFCVTFSPLVKEAGTAIKMVWWLQGIILKRERERERDRYS